MTTQDIQNYIDEAIRSKFEGCTSESGEITTDPGGDGRFFGKVTATRYAGLSDGYVFLAIGQTDKQVQIIKLGNSECVTPSKTDLDLLLLKELAIESENG
jgi:hypothetical protein